jgi:hypothetical protein
MIGDTELEQRIRERAHQIWEDQGRPEGRDQEHWSRAEQEINANELTSPPLQPDTIGGGLASASLVDQGEGLPPGETG